MAFDREKFAKILHDSGGFFTDRKTAERAVRDCGGAIKGVEKCVMERDGGHVARTGECVSIITAVEPELVLDERGIKQPVARSAHDKQAVTHNGPHEHIEYVPLHEKPVPGQKYRRSQG